MKPWCRAAAVAALASACAVGHAADTALERMTSTEVAAAIAGGKRVVLVPIGGIEQTGSHVALGKHNRRAELLAAAIAGRRSDALVAPVVAYVPEGTIDPPSAHMRFAGTISIPSDTFVASLVAIGASLARHGFSDIVFLGDHGGYQADLGRATEQLNRRLHATGARAHAPSAYYRAASHGFPALLRARGFSAAAIGTHGGLADTSLMLALDPSLVRSDALSRRPDPRTDGDPSAASAELGALGVALIVSETTSAIGQALASRRAAQYAPSDRPLPLKRQP